MLTLHSVLMLGDASWEEIWKDKKVKSLHEVVDFNHYSKSSLPEIVTVVELSKIVGTTYEEYSKGTWGQMMKGLKPRRETDIFPSDRYFDMVRHTHDHSQGSKLFQQPITLAKYGEEYIIYGGGNHRICHAKYIGIPTLLLRVQEYVIDPALKKADVAAHQTTAILPKPKLPLWEQAFDWLFAKLGL
jgi:hypothetical protein